MAWAVNAVEGAKRGTAAFQARELDALYLRAFRARRGMRDVLAPTLAALRVAVYEVRRRGLDERLPEELVGRAVDLLNGILRGDAPDSPARAGCR